MHVLLFNINACNDEAVVYKARFDSLPPIEHHRLYLISVNTFLFNNNVLVNEAVSELYIKQGLTVYPQSNILDGS